MKYIYYLALFFTLTTYSQAAGSLDNSFNTIDTGFDVISGTNERVLCTQIQSDGKVLIVGAFTAYNGVSVNKIARLNTDGTLDTTFNIGSGFTTATSNQGITKIVLQADGKIIVAGTFTAYNGFTCKDLVRLNTDGTLDTSFNIGTGFNNTISSISIQTNGNIFACGGFTTFNNFPANHIVKLNSNGSIDTSFNATNSGADATVIDFAFQTDGKIVVIGSFANYDGVPQNKIARLNIDGTIDITFNIGSGFVGTTNSVKIQTDGKIIVGGSFSSYNGINKKNLIRLLTDGTIDNNFNTGTGPSSTVTSVNIQSDGKMIILGSFSSYNNISKLQIARLNSTGVLDTSFTIEPIFLNTDLSIQGYLYDPTKSYSYSQLFNSISFLTNGKMILGGAFQTTTFSGANIKRINANGTFDATFNTTYVTGANGPVNAIAIQNDGKIIIGGGFSEFNSYLSPGIVRLNTDGSVDTSFISNFYTRYNKITTINDICIQPDGKILVTGLLWTEPTYNTSKFYLRLNENGTIDDTFVISNSNSNIFNLRNSVCLQSDSKVLFGGGNTVPRIKRLNSDGSVDTTFNNGTSFNSTVNEIKIQSDGKILVGGNFSSYNGIAKNGIARLNSNGVYDLTFSGTGAVGSVKVIEIQNDRKIIIGGNFSTYNGVTAKSLARINTDGSIDSSFSLSSLSTSSYNINDICVQPDGKILVSINLALNAYSNKSMLVRLNSNGTIDNSFTSETGSQGIYDSSNSNNDFTVNSIKLQSDGKLLIGGNFTSYNALGRNRLARLNATNALSVNDNEIINGFVIYPNPANDKFTMDFGNDMITNYTVKINNMLGQEVYSNIINEPQFEVTKTWQGQGMYFVKIFNEQNILIGTKKIILQ